jgi:hypothetical protein
MYKTHTEADEGDDDSPGNLWRRLVLLNGSSSKSVSKKETPTYGKQADVLDRNSSAFSRLGFYRGANV